MPDIKLSSPLQFVKGVGPRKAAALAQKNLNTVEDLLYYFPRHYLDRTNVVPIAEAKIDQAVTIIGEVTMHGVLHGRRRRYQAILQDETGMMSLLFFQGVNYWQRVFKKGQVYAASGTISYFMGSQMVHPDLERLDPDSNRMVHAGRIIPVYPQTAELSKVGLSSKGLRTITAFVFEHLRERIDDHLSEKELSKFGLPPLHEAITRIHFPQNRDQVEESRRRLAYDELLKLQFLIYRTRGKRATVTKAHTYSRPGEKLTNLREKFPYELTAAQKAVIKQILGDLQSPRPMARLLHGDVGCGKTVVAVLAALYAAENRLQCAFMAPTEILAEQHYRNWSDPLAAVGVRPELLTASLRPQRKKAVAEACANGEVDILFGTHALIYDYVNFSNLALVIIDEQHRFGVEQRGKLHAKGDNADLLIMTATPIPRTLALTLYGDLDISTIDSLPPGRKPIRTVWRPLKARDKVYDFAKEEIRKGGQIYIIYPLIEKSEQMELENVEDAYKELTRGAFKDYRVAMVHGRVKPKERDDILAKFRDGGFDILVATTVVEVGIDNPNATVMMIEHAERFGLAQLHQLRGRVGRGAAQATVVAIAHHPISDIGRQRLEYFAAQSDGFRIAEADLKLRGPGEVFGQRQSGIPDFRVADPWKDQDLLDAARDFIKLLFENQEALDRESRKVYNYLNDMASRRIADLGGG
jgi:ATP-dependent DNA helicase RecG